MAYLTLDNIRDNALKFVKNHVNDSAERQQAQSWVKDFLEDIFGIHKRKVNAGFEWRVRTDTSQLYVDHLLNGVLLIEMKSRGKSLDKAKSQAYQYVMKLKDEDIPKYVMLCDFETIHLFDLDGNNDIQFLVSDLPQYVETFNFLINKEINVTAPQSPVNKEAAILLEKLHSLLREKNYPQNGSSLLMTRLVFCLFADDTGIFEKNQFRSFLINHTAEDGSDLLDKLTNLFVVLNTPVEERYQSEVISDFRYINGDLFNIPIPSGINLGHQVRDMLLEVSRLDWSQISPVIFGSMFEGALDEEKRHDLGAHYTSEENIMKVLDSLFLDELYTELESITELKAGRLKRYIDFHDKLASLTFFDPACGSGNFLMLAYREIRRLENEVIKLTRIEEFLADNRKISSVSSEELRDMDYQDSFFSIENSVKVNVSQFYGIEIESYAASIAKLGLWLIDHLMNIETSEIFSRYFVRLPLDTGANIYALNAMEVDWRDIISPRDLDYIIGNPPFIGARLMDSAQTNEIRNVTQNNRAGNLDYVAGWYYKSAKMMDYNPDIKAGLVSTDAIVQGLQAPIIWKDLFKKNIHINFAHRPFRWDNEAKVIVVIIGFSKKDNKDKNIFEYKDFKSKPNAVKANEINEYLLDAEPVLLSSSRSQISNQPKMTFGSMPNDGGNFILNEEEMKKIIKAYPELEDYIHLFLGSKEIIRNEKRYILYLKNAPRQILRNNGVIKERVEKVKETRSKSKRKATRELASYPYLFGEDRTSKSEFLIIPSVSSERREYIPMAFEKWPTITSNLAFQLDNANLYIFGVLQTRMHTLWLKTVGGKKGQSFRYSNTLVYNTFVFPNSSESERQYISDLAENILGIQEKYFEKGNSLADIYDPLFMPKDLRKAHEQLDNAVERNYKSSGFNSDKERLEHLMKLYIRKNRKK